MNGRELEEIAQLLYPEPLDWKKELCKLFEIHPITVRRWLAQDRVPVPEATCLYLLYLYREECKSHDS